jgi:Transposase DNA-binding/Transposase Tn5 dimerisation domain
MDVIPDARDWAEHHFGAAELGDPRRARRLVDCAARIAGHPEKSFPQVFDWGQLRAFYNLCHQPKATLEAVQRPHWELTRRAMGQLPLVLIVHDTTELDFSSHPALRGAGPIGDHRGKGFLQHNSLAFTPDGPWLLGLSHQQLHVRRPAPAKETTRARKKRDRESRLWLEGVRAPGRPPEGSVWVNVGDRGADVYEAMEAALGVGQQFLFRACQNRRVFTAPEHGRAAYLMDYARGLAAQGEDVVEIKGQGGRPPRAARVALAAAPVWVPAAKDTPGRKSRPVLRAWVIRVWEEAAPAGEEALEWVLLCSVPTRTLAEIKQRRDWYGCRWGAEVYHDIEKNGCSEEERMFQTAGRMEACLAVLAVVAVRVYQLRLAVKVAPQEPAAAVATAAEIEVVQEWLATKEGLSVRQFVCAVAKLGGFLGRKGDGEPGVRSLWRGYQRLQDMAVGFRLRSSRAHNTS